MHKTVALIQASWILSLPLALLRESNPKVVQGFELSLCVIMLFAVVPESFLPPQPYLSIIKYAKGRIHELICGGLGSPAA